MNAERDHLIRVVFPELAERMAARRLHLRPVDLRWGVLPGEDSVEICLDVLERCRPFLVGILGGRYGFVPSGADRSITEMEIKRGVLEDSVQRMISSFYFRDPSTNTHIPSEVRDSYVEPDPRARAALERLKGEIADAGLKTRTYRCRWDSEHGGFADLEDFGRMVLEDLWEAIVAEYPESAAPVDPLAPEREAMDAFVAARAERFRGREGPRRELKTAIEERLGSDDAPGVVCVVGEPGSGKSSLLGDFTRTYPKERPELLLVSHFIGASAASTDVEDLLERLWREVARGIGLREEPPADLQETARTLPNFLERAAAVRPICLVIDALDQLEDVHDAPAMWWLPERIPPGVCVAVSANEGRALDALRHREPIREVLLGDLTANEARQVVQSYLAIHLRKLSEAQWSALLGKGATRNPLYLLVALEELRLTGRFDDLEQQIGSLPDDVPDMFGAVLERLEKDHGEGPVRDLCAFLAVGRGGQIEEDVRTMVGAGAPVRDMTWERLVRSMGVYLLRRSEFVDFFHRQLRDAVIERYLRDERAIPYHRRFAEHLLRRGYSYPRTLTELPHQLRRAGMDEELFAVVEDPDFRQAKLALTTSASRVVADVGIALDAAFEKEDLPRAASLGFLHADLAEGRFGKQDVLELHRIEPGLALEEVRLFRERPRFRLLVLLALHEAELGRTSAASDLIDAAVRLRGVRLRDSDAPFLARAALRLLSAGCPDGPRVLSNGVPPRIAARAAAASVSGGDASSEGALLEAAARALGRGEEGQASAEDIPPVAALAAAAARPEMAGGSSVILEELEEAVSRITPLIEMAKEQEDTLMIGAALALMGMGGGGGQGAAEAAQAHVGTGYVKAGDEARGHDLLARAVATVGDRFVDPASLAGLTRALVAAGTERAEDLLGRLALGSGRQPSDLRVILDALGAAPDATPRFVRALVPAINRLPPRSSGELIADLAIAYGRTGDLAVARDQGSTVALNRAVLWLLAVNPLLSRSQRSAVARQQVRLVALTGVRSRDWTGRWLARMGRWVAKIEPEASRADGSEQLVALAGETRMTGGFQPVLDAVQNMRDEGLARDVLVAAIDAAEGLDTHERASVRAGILDSAGALSQDVPRAETWIRWIGTADATEVEQVLALAEAVDTIADPDARADVLGAVAGFLSAIDVISADRVWQRAAIADQDSAGRARIFAARVSASSRSANVSAWEETKSTAECPDPEVAAWALEFASVACREPGRLSELEKRARRIPWTVASREHLLPMCFSLARAWARLDRPKRAADLLLWALGRGRARHLSLPDLSQVTAMATELAPTRSGRTLLVRLIPHASHASPGEVGVFEELAFAFTRLPRSWSRAAYRQLFMAALDRDEISKWTGAETLAGIAAGLARGGSPRVAKAVLEGIRIPGDAASAEESLLQPAATAAASLRLGRAFAAVGSALQDTASEMKAAHFLDRAMESAALVTGQFHQGDAVRLQVETWMAMKQLEQAAADGARQEIEERALQIAHDSAVSPAAGLTAVARAYTRVGELDRALWLARQIRNDDASAILLEELVAAAGAEDLQVVGRYWQRIPSSEGRRRTAHRLIHARSLPEETPDAAGRPTAEVPWVPRVALRTRMVRAAAFALLFLALPALTYWFGARWTDRAIEGLDGSTPLPWGIGLGAAILVLWAATVRALKTSIRKERRRIMMGLLLVPLAPLLIPAYLYLEPYHDRRSELRARLSTWFRLPVRARDMRGRTSPRGMPPDETSYAILRAAASEAESFDLLLSGVVASGDASESLLEALPGLQLPLEPPERVREAQRTVEQLRHERKLRVRTAAAFRKVLGGSLRVLGRVLVLVIATPVTFVSATRRTRRRRRAIEAGRTGSRLIGQGRFREGSHLLRRATQEAPDVAQFWHDYAVSLAQLGDIDAAVGAHGKATDRGIGSSDEPQFWYGMGFTLFNAGRWEEALGAFDKTLEIAEPGSMEYEQAQNGRRYCLQNLGQKA